MNAAQFRIARPTNQLFKIEEFYTKALGLNKIGDFYGHEGYDGIMIGLPNSTHHLEFTFHPHQAISKPTKENLLVLYYDDLEKFLAANSRLQYLGYHPVKPENPYWNNISLTYEDPDGWRVVVVNGLYEPRAKL